MDHLSLCVCPLSGVDVPFSRWSRDDVCAWLQDQGLGLYVDQAQNWLQSGQTLLQASQHDLEKVGRPRWSRHNLRAPFKEGQRTLLPWLHTCMFVVQELSMRQPLHRKKLQLALQALGSANDLMGKLDHTWVTSEYRPPTSAGLSCFNMSLSCFDLNLGCFNLSFSCFNLSLGRFDLSLGCFDLSLGSFRVAGRHRPPPVQEPL